MNRNDLIKELFHKYHLQQELPPASREKMADLRKKTLVSILRSKGKYSLVLVPVLKVFYLSRRLGIPLSMSKSAIAAATALAVASGTVSAGTYYTIRHVYNYIKDSHLEEPAIPGKNTKPGIQVNNNNAYQAGTKLIHLAIGEFQSFGESGTILAHHLKKSLLKALNKRESVGQSALLQHIHENRIKNVKYILLGSVIELENSYRISARLVEQKTSKIIMYTSETVTDKEQINKAANIIADRIADVF